MARTLSLLWVLRKPWLVLAEPGLQENNLISTFTWMVEVTGVQITHGKDSVHLDVVKNEERVVGSCSNAAHGTIDDAVCLVVGP